jgi:hypothetical protein
LVAGALGFQELSMSLSDAEVAREARYEAPIEAAFDQAEAHALVGDFRGALEWLAQAEDLYGGLPDAYIELRKRWIGSLAPLAVVGRR